MQPGTPKSLPFDCQGLLATFKQKSSGANVPDGTSNKIAFRRRGGCNKGTEGTANVWTQLLLGRAANGIPHRDFPGNKPWPEWQLLKLPAVWTERQLAGSTHAGGVVTWPLVTASSPRDQRHTMSFLPLDYLCRKHRMAGSNLCSNSSSLTGPEDQGAPSPQCWRDRVTL